MLWYGLTREEAELRCKEKGRQARFLVTKDPKITNKAYSAEKATLDILACSAPEATGILKVIRANEETHTISFLLGYFAEETWRKQ